MKVAPRDVARFLAAPPEHLRACLIYGADAGQVRELATGLAKSVAPDLDDPFRVVSMDAQTLAADPARLADEAAAIAFGGGRRVIRLRGLDGNHARLIGDAIKEPVGDALIVAEAGQLRRDAALVKLFEGAESGAAIPCYGDEGRGLSALLDEALKAEGVSLTPDARAYVTARLGVDRSATRQEIEKLVLYAGQGGRLDLDDVVEAAGDAGTAGVDDLVYAAAGGDVTGCHRAFDRLLAAGAQPIQIQRALMNHLVRLRGVVSKAETAGLEPALAGLRPPIFFKRKPAFEAQARRWTRQRLSLAIDRMIQAEIELKRTGSQETLALWRACFDVARAGAARPRAGSNSR